MKRVAAFILTLIMLTSTVGVGASEVNLELIINGEKQTGYTLSSVYVGTANNQMLAPSGEFSAALGAESSVNGDKVTMTGNGNTVIFTANKDNALVNGGEESLVIPSRIIDGVHYVPVEFCGEKLGFNVLKQRSGNRIRIFNRTGITAPALKQNSGMKDLYSTVHRKVPTKFEKSNVMTVDNLIYNKTDYSDTLDLPDASEIGPYPEGGEVIFSYQDFIDEMADSGYDGEWWYTDIVDANSGNKITMDVKMGGVSIGGGDNSESLLPFTKALQFDVPKARSGFNDMVHHFEKSLRSPDKDDNYVLTVYLRLIDGGEPDADMGAVHLWIENPNTWAKPVDATVRFGREWTRFDFLVTGVEGATRIRFMPPVYKQVIQVGGYQIRNVGKDTDVSYFTELKTDNLAPELRPDAPWRAEALERIEKVRKGDFKVVVKDKNGNPVPNASIELDMFEHEFKFGVQMDVEYLGKKYLEGYTIPDYTPNSEKYAKAAQLTQRIGPLFNALAVGNRLKWGPYARDAVANPGMTSTARLVIENAKNQGLKYVRGHAIWMPENKHTEDPQEVYNQLNGAYGSHSERYTKLMSLISDHMTELNEMFPEIYEWDVTNETHGRTFFTDTFGMDILKDVYKLAGEKLTNGQSIMLCDNRQFEEQYWERLDWFKEQGIKYDAIGLQGHSPVGSMDTYGNYIPTKWLAAWDRIAYEYHKTFAITEFSARTFHDEYSFEGQGDYMRDMMIAAFSHPACTGFGFWWLSDYWSDWNTPYNPENPNNNGNGAGVSPLYTHEFKAKPGLKQYQDLVYNKWWTKDAKATTNSNGEGTVRGYYGDYDVTVTAGGTEKTVMAAFHKGYENVLEIIID